MQKDKIYGKSCNQCGVLKDIGDFPYFARNVVKKIGDTCKSCMNKKHKEYLLNKKDSTTTRHYDQKHTKNRNNHYASYFSGFSKAY